MKYNKERREIILDKELNKLYAETNEKFIGRVQNMLYHICGLDKKRAKEILEECLKRNEKKKI